VKRVVLLMVPGIELRKQWEHCLAYADTHRLKVSAIADIPEAAASVVDAGHADEALAAIPAWGRAGEPACLTGRVRYVRTTLARPSKVDTLDQLGAALLKHPNRLGDVSEADLRTALETVRRALEAPTPPPATHTHPRNAA
jgi:hypothetical protein